MDLTSPTLKAHMLRMLGHVFTSQKNLTYTI